MSPQKRDIGFVFQHYAAFKHMTVRDNVAFGLKIRKRPSRRSRRRSTNYWGSSVSTAFSIGTPRSSPAVNVSAWRWHALWLWIRRCSLLDEPFGALDAKVRADLRTWLRRLHDEVHVTTVLVTHDQEEALDVADRIAVLNKGRIEQIGEPADLYDRPSNDFVMSFLGSVAKLNGQVGPSARHPSRPRSEHGSRAGIRNGRVASASHARPSSASCTSASRFE